MKTITVVENIAEPDSWETVQIGDQDICEWLTHRWEVLPDSARIYHEQISDTMDVTPHRGGPGQLEAEIDRLRELDGQFFVVIWPEGPLVILIIVAIAMAAVAIALAFLLRPHTPAQNQGSPNNDMSERTNKARPNERIPDIVGTVRSVPDLIALPYKIFISNQEYEIAPMCIGRGYYTVIDCQDDTTPVPEIGGEFVAVYNPGYSPNLGASTPAYTFGTNPLTAIPAIISVRRSNAANGQVLRAPNAGTLVTNNNTTVQCGDVNGNSGALLTNGGSGSTTIDFTDYFIATTPTLNSYLTFENTEISDQSQNYHSVWLNGTYLILAVTSNQVTLSKPGQNPTDGALWANGWTSGDVIYNFSGSDAGAHAGGYHTDQGSSTIYSGTNPAVGPFVMQVPDATGCILNFVAPNGLYSVDSSGNQHALSITLEATVQNVDLNNNPIGGTNVQTITLTGDAVNRTYIGATLQMNAPSTGPFQVTVIRLTDKGTTSGWTYVDQVQWRDLYSSSPVTLPSDQFGDVTTLMAITEQTMDSLVVKERKLNLLVTRNLPTWSNRQSGTFALPSGVTVPTFTSTLYPTNNAADIICALALDPWVGRRAVSELDVPGIYACCDALFYNGASGSAYNRADGAIASYVGGTTKSGFLLTEFCFTFDDSKVSFEESLADIAQALNSTIYRAGSKISIFFEQATSNSLLLFNHRNVIPDSLTVTDTYGTLNDNDGIEYTSINPNSANAQNEDIEYINYYPVAQTATNPKKIKAVGVRNPYQANFNGFRLYNKLLNQNSQVEFECTQEAAVLILRNRILVADETRRTVQAGDVLNVSGLVVTGSIDIDWTNGSAGGTCTAFFQLPNGTVQAIGVSQPSGSTDARQMLLASAPSINLIFNSSMYARATFILSFSTDSANKQANAYLLADKAPQENATYKLTAINYSAAYYANDQDYVNSVTGNVPPPAYGYAAQGYTGQGDLTQNLLPYS
ncbi:MAG: host specificity factor TipJ family phage tail protein [Minisyncoccia bacterium]